MSQDSFSADPLDQMWYLQGEAEALGPYTGHVLKQMIEAGSIGAASLVAMVGATRWSAVADVPWFASCLPPAAAPHRYAGFWIRLLAHVLDSLLVTVAFVVVAAISGALIAVVSKGAASPDQVGMLVWIPILVASVLALFYFIYFPATRWQATPGKRICGIYVIRVDGRPVTGLLALGRQLAYFLSSLPFCIGFLMIAFTREKYGLHDLVCGTRVVYGRL